MYIRASLSALVLTGCMLSSDEVWDKVDEVPEGDSDTITISTIQPPQGPVNGGTSVSIGATPLTEAPQVYFDGMRATVTDWSGNNVLVTTPRFDGEGFVDIEIWSGARYGVAIDGFYAQAL